MSWIQQVLNYVVPISVIGGALWFSVLLRHDEQGRRIEEAVNKVRWDYMNLL